MKKSIIVILVAMMCFSLSACGKETSQNAENSANTPSESALPTSDTTDEEAPTASYDADAIKEEAKAAFDTFMAAASQMENNSEFDTVFSYYEKMEDSFAQRYAEYYIGIAAEYKEMTPFEQFLWYELYINPVMYTTLVGYDTYFSDLGRYQATVTSTCYSALKRQGDSGKEIANAYQSLMEWQYNFFVEHGSMYNFITEKSSAEENPNYIIPDPAKQRAEQAAQEQQELQELRDELQKEN